MAGKRRKRQFTQDSFFAEAPRVFGGSLHKGNPKIARTLNTKESVHLVLKSEFAIGRRSMLRPANSTKIDKIVRRQAKQCKIRIYQFVNVGNHLHLLIKLDSRRLFSKFIRAVTGLIARWILGRERGLSTVKKEVAKSDRNRTRKRYGFWVARPFTRLVAWGKDYNYVKNYMDKNRRQANGTTSKQLGSYAEDHDHFGRNRGRFVAWGFDVVDPYKIEYLKTG